ncbi:MAG TPA: MDR family MFS transporter [Streptosporangiaceae bacterium]|nr:MDR family MFS transporter [Streptosporangiaceae bacterium]
MAEAKATATPSGGAETSGVRREVLIILPGLLLAIMLAMLDQLVVSTALPRIVGDLGGVTHLSWVVTAYVLASTVTTPLYGKLGDQYGRKRWLMVGIVIFLIGSALSGLAHSMDQLIAFRALQGLGAGGLLTGAIATIGDLVSPRERGQYMGYIMGVMTLAMIAGPLVGGYITENFSWRWIFYINMPIGGAALIYLALTMHVPRHRIAHKIDYAGAIALTIAATSIILMTTWGGTQYAWASVQVIGLAVLGLVSTAAFLAIEARAAEPILPLGVFRNRNFSVAIAMSFLLGLALFGALTFLPLYQQTVQHLSPTQSGLMLIPMMLGSTVTALISGQVTTKTGRYKVLPIVGAAMMTLGMYLLTGIGLHTSLVTTGIYFAVIGLGMGFLMQITTLVAQNSVAPQEMGVASSSRTFFQQIGGSIGVAAFGAVFARRLVESLTAHIPSGVHMSVKGAQLNPATVNHLPALVRADFFVAITHAVTGVFWLVVPAAAIVFLLAWLIKEVPLRGRAPVAEEPVTPELVS